MAGVRKLFMVTPQRWRSEIKTLATEPVFTKNISEYAKGNDIFKRAYSSYGQVSSDYATPLIPTETANFFYDRIYWENKLRNIVTTIPMPRATFRIPVKTAGSKVYRATSDGVSFITELGLDGASSGYVSPTVSYLDLIATKFGSLSGWTTELEEDSIISIPQLMFEELAISMGEYEELAMLQGDESDGHSLTGTITGYDDPSSGFGAGDVRYSFDGMIFKAPGSNSNVWTPDDTSPENKFDGGSNKLTRDELNTLIAQIEEQGYECTDIFMRPKVAGRLRDDVEFEQFQSIKDIGTSKAALIKGFVGDFYGANVFVTNRIPEGTAFGTGADDSVVLGFDRRLPLIGDRRRISFVKRHAFTYDAEEIRVTERVAFNTKFNEGIAVINDVKNAA